MILTIKHLKYFSSLYTFVILEIVFLEMFVWLIPLIKPAPETLLLQCEQKELGYSPVRQRDSASVSDDLLAEECRRRSLLLLSNTILCIRLDLAAIITHTHCQDTAQFSSNLPWCLAEQCFPEGDVVIKLPNSIGGLEWPIPHNAMALPLTQTIGIIHFLGLKHLVEFITLLLFISPN